MTADEPRESRPARSLPSALDAFEVIVSRAGNRELAVFLDYDGTLSPIVARPELAVLDERMREAVRQLGERVRVGVISGRDLADVEGMVGLAGGIAYAGSHGFQVRDADGREHVAVDAEPYRADLEAAAARLDEALAAFPGSIVERKGFAVAAHYRQVAEDRQEALRASVEAVASAFPQLRVTGGKMIAELRPRLDWDKGRAVRMLIERWGGDEIFPVYLGDDETDEDAFRALRGHGVGIVVGDADHTDALYQLRDVSEVEAWLTALRRHLPGAD